MEASEQFCLRWNNHQQNLRTTMAEHLENQTFTDVTIGVEDGQSIQCHKMILAASSTYFETIFGEYPCEHTIVVLNDVKYKEIVAIVEYMYKGEVNVPGNELPALFKVAEALEIKGLVRGSKESPPRHLSHQPEVVDRSFTESTEMSENRPGVRESSSPPHSTSLPYYSTGNALASLENGTVGAKLSPSTWPYSSHQGFPVEGHNPIAAAAALQSSLSAHYSSLLGSSYDNGAEALPRRRRKRKMSNNSIIMNRNTPILRTALNQGQVDSSQTQAVPMLHHINRPDAHYRCSSNGSANNESDDKHSGTDAFNSHPIHSPYESETSMIDEDENKSSRRSFTDDTNTGTYGSAQKLGTTTKRYKKYTNTDIAGAIAAVIESGMSANKAAALFRVPSRTLYDKISRAKKEEPKNGGIVTPKRRRNASNSGACFPYGIGGNATGSIYGHYSESDHENVGVPMDNPAGSLETTFAASRDNSSDREIKMEIVQKSSSPQLPVHSQISPREENANEAEDLSVKPKSQVHVIMPPSIAIKEAV